MLQLQQRCVDHLEQLVQHASKINMVAGKEAKGFNDKTEKVPFASLALSLALPDVSHDRCFFLQCVYQLVLQLTLNVNIAVQNLVRDMVVRWIQQYMITNGFYFGSSVYDECTVACVGKSNLVEAKQNLPKFTQVHTMVRVCLH